MKIQAVHPNGSFTVLVPHGPLVGEERLDLRRAIENAMAQRAPAQRVIVDMADVPYMDSPGVELLLEMCGVEPGGAQSLALHRPKLAALSETVLETLQLTDCLQRLDVFDSVESALRSEAYPAGPESARRGPDVTGTGTGTGTETGTGT